MCAKEKREYRLKKFRKSRRVEEDSLSQERIDVFGDDAVFFANKKPARNEKEIIFSLFDRRFVYFAERTKKNGSFVYYGLHKNKKGRSFYRSLQECRIKSLGVLKKWLSGKLSNDACFAYDDIFGGRLILMQKNIKKPS